MAATGVRGYCLDNEPALWFDTHPRIHPDKVTYIELINKSVALSTAVKKCAFLSIFGNFWSIFARF